MVPPHIWNLNWNRSFLRGTIWPGGCAALKTPFSGHILAPSPFPAQETPLPFSAFQDQFLPILTKYLVLPQDYLPPYFFFRSTHIQVNINARHLFLMAFQLGHPPRFMKFDIPPSKPDVIPIITLHSILSTPYTHTNQWTG